MFCKECGKEIDENSKFCNNCGVEVIDRSKERKVVYEGDIHKCPNCGEMLKSFMTNCPSCNFELNRKEITSSLKEFIEKINKCNEEIAGSNYIKTGWASWGILKKGLWIILNIFLFGIPLIVYWGMPLVLINKTPKLNKEEKQMANLIENFPFPNDRESILAAIMFAKEKIDFLSNESVDRKSAYWLRLWKSKAEQLKQKADMLFPDDSIVKKSYNDIIDDVNKINRTIKIKRILGVIILIFAIFLFWSNNSSNNTETTNKKDYNITFEWQTNGLFGKLPEPETNNGKIVSETEKQIQIELYNITPEKFNSYVKKCRESGFTFNIIKTDSSFYAKDVDGYALDILYYNQEQEMKIYLDSYNLKINK